jgi:hypothetical protein
MQALKYLVGYPEPVQSKVRELIAQNRIEPMLREKYSEAHAVRNDRQLYDYTLAMKERFLRKAAPLNKVVYDNRLQVMKHAHQRIAGAGPTAQGQ